MKIENALIYPKLFLSRSTLTLPAEKRCKARLPLVRFPLPGGGHGPVSRGSLERRKSWTWEISKHNHVVCHPGSCEMGCSWPPGQSTELCAVGLFPLQGRRKSERMDLTCLLPHWQLQLWGSNQAGRTLKSGRNSSRYLPKHYLVLCAPRGYRIKQKYFCWWLRLWKDTQQLHQQPCQDFCYTSMEF